MKELLPPESTPEYMYGAWASCLSWAAGHKGIRERFEKETGIDFRSPRSVIESMIDNATGKTTEAACKFVDWFNENIWGDVNAPDDEETATHT